MSGWRIRIRSNEACLEDQPFLAPDMVLQTNLGPELRFDLALAGPDEPMNRMGLRSLEALHTAVILQLFTDRRKRADQLHLDPRDPDPRGWWGDSVDVRVPQGETELGSHLWLLRRSILTAETVAQADDYVREALQPIVDQGAVASFNQRVYARHTNMGAHPATGVLCIEVDGLSFDGNRRYAQHFQVLWDQIAALAA